MEGGSGESPVGTMAVEAGAVAPTSLHAPGDRGSTGASETQGRHLGQMGGLAHVEGLGLGLGLGLGWPGGPGMREA